MAIRGWTIARAASGVLHRQIKEKTVTKTTRAKAIEREVVKNDIHHVPTSVDAYTVAALKEWFEDKDIATGLQLSLNKNLLTSLGSNFTDHKELGFRDEAALAKAHKSIDLKYLRQLNRMATRLLNDAVFEPSRKVDTAGQSKLNGILRTVRSHKSSEEQSTTTTRNDLLSRGRSPLCRSGPKCTTSTRA